MSDRFGRLLVVAGLLFATGTLSACARPVGDFGRAQPSVLHDEILPGAGRVRATISGEPVSKFNRTDEEAEMHDRIWRFLTAPHANDWFMDTAVELQRTRVAGPQATAGFEPSRYYLWLQRRNYESSRVRYRTVADHARSDIDTAPATFAAICRVLEVDRQRELASAELRGLSHEGVAARRAENQMAIGWFTSAIRYRYDAYAYALDHLLVETPHREAMDTDGRLGELAAWVEAAERGDFCDDQRRGRDQRQEALPGRVLMPEKPDGLVRK